MLDQRDLSKPSTPNDIVNPIFILKNDPFNQVFVSTTQDVGAFANVNFTLFDHLRVLVGGRWDYYDVSAINNGGFTYNVPTHTRYTGDDNRGSYTGSVNYTLPYGVTPYITYASSPSLITQQGGGIDPGSVADKNFLAPSILMEAGVKGYAFDNRLYYAVDAYRQTRTQFQQLGGTPYVSRGEGFEGTLRFAITHELGLVMTADEQNTKVSSGGVVVTPVQAGVAYIDGYGYYYSTGISNFVDKTLPQYTFTALLSYKSDQNWGANLGMIYVDKTSGELANSFYAPGYVLFNGSVSYKYRKFLASFTLDNIFDKRYFTPLSIGTGYTEGAVLPGMGRTMLFQISRSF